MLLSLCQRMEFWAQGMEAGFIAPSSTRPSSFLTNEAQGPPTASGGGCCQGSWILQSHVANSNPSPTRLLSSTLVPRGVLATLQHAMRDAIAEAQLVRDHIDGKVQEDDGFLQLMDPYGRPNTDAAYDYIIVGGGTAGLTIAARLTQNTSLSVAVVEAGGYYEETVGNISTVPAYAAFNVGTDPTDTNAIDWGFVTEPQPVRALP
ncbi:MAG: hypothetical protein Q9199_005343 [Rusavskia elegans]